MARCRLRQAVVAAIFEPVERGDRRSGENGRQHLRVVLLFFSTSHAFLRAMLVRIAKNAFRMLWKMLGGVAISLEDIVVEHGSPHGSLVGWQVLQRKKGVYENVVWTANVCTSVVPPIVHQKIELRERLTPCHQWIRDVIASPGSSVADRAIFSASAKAWKAIKIGIEWIDHTDWRTGRRQLERSGIHVGHLLGRKKRESSPAGDDDANIFIVVKVR